MIFCLHSSTKLHVQLDRPQLPCSACLFTFCLILEVMKLIAADISHWILGNSDFIEGQQESFDAVLDDCIEPQPTTCNKDIGSKQRLQKWSRGHLFIVRGGGIIDKWSPLFKWVSKHIFSFVVCFYKYTQCDERQILQVRNKQTSAWKKKMERLTMTYNPSQYNIFLRCSCCYFVVFFNNWSWGCYGI